MSLEVFKAPASPRRKPRSLRTSLGARQPAASSFMPENYSELDDYAQVFEAGRSGDPFDVVRGYMRIAANRVDKLISRDASQDEIDTWSLERRTWALVDILYSYRAAAAPAQGQTRPLKVHRLTSNTIAEESFYRQNKHARENLLVIAWLQRTLSNPAGPELRGVKWQVTRAQVKHKKVAGFGITATVVKTLDPDGPLRENNATIHPDDAEFDRSLFRHVFALLQAGDYEAAQQVCDQTGNYTLTAAMNGMVEYRDPVLDGVVLNPQETVARGTKRKALWRRMCLQLARAPQADKFERAIYGLLAGDLDSVLAVSESWEAQLLAYVHHLAATEIETYLVQLGRLNLTNPDLLAFPQSQASSISDILNALSESPSPVVRAQSDHPLRHIQGGIINNVVAHIMHDARRKIESVRDEVEDSNVLMDDAYLLRLLAHLALFLKSIGMVDGGGGDDDYDDDAVAVLKFYVQDLAICDKGHLVPLYVSQLPEPDAIEAYSFLLADISDPNKRAEQFRLADKFNLDIVNTLRRTIQRVFDEYEDDYPAVESHADLDLTHESPADHQLSNSLLWFVDAQMWDDVVDSANALYLRFLLSGKIKSAENLRGLLANSQLYNVLNEFEQQVDYSMAEIEDAHLPGTRARTEFRQYDSLIVAVSLIREWDAVHAADKVRDRAWRLRAKDVIDRVKPALVELVCGWMTTTAAAASDESDDKRDAIHRLRVLYVPYLLLELHRILQQGQPVHKIYRNDALEMVNLVASDELDIYKLLVEADRLDEYLVAVASVSLVVGADSQNGIWRV
ncbi:nuclear pore protein 84/107 [Lipomyces orientalis]|uniref:Nuclear pore protein 84/107 n=1 Tax=Lipomyces orientalis TaxID=1233043 RepID=A0ACC3TI56_9ASCO